MSAVVFAAMLASFGAVSVTNHAGGVISGELTAVTNGTFTLAGRTLPLAILPAAEQRRLKELAGQDVRTARERQRAKMLDYELRRIDVRLAAGDITSEQAEALRRDARASAAFRKNQPKRSPRGQ
ncbi:MAG: hypothetical protein MJ249_09010 [Kiritimatiellae bacterium]|nr:hypothetical protein [Kiritimatiellia bacterium]